MRRSHRAWEVFVIKTLTFANRTSFDAAVQRFERAYERKQLVERTAGSDTVELSAMARLLSQPDQAQSMRHARIEQIKSQIQAGEYETPQKLEAAVNELLKALEIS